MLSEKPAMGLSGNHAEKFVTTTSSLKRNSASGLSSRKNGDGAFSDVQSDIIVQVDDVGFALHKFPLSSRSGRIRKLLADIRDMEPSQIELPSLPGGADAFELAAKFCYGINFEITTSNVAVLYCVSDYLEMTEDCGEGNLLALTEAFFKEVVLQSLEKSVEVLHACENILPRAEEKKIVNKCIDTIASKVCKEQTVSSLCRLDCISDHSNNLESSGPQNKAVVEWWAEDLSILRIDMFQRVLAAMRSRGLRNESIGGALMHYAQRSLKNLSKKQSGMDPNGRFKTKLHEMSATLEHEQRILVETIVSLLPAERNIFPTSFLFSLLRTAIILDTTLACRLDLERRIGLQLEQATLDDLLIPSLSQNGDALFDVDIVHRVLSGFLQQEENQGSMDGHAVYESENLGTPSQRSIMRIAKLIEIYLAEIAPDANLKVSKFIALAELLPDHARVVDDGLYRAIDIYLKAHPTLSDLERKKICKLMDCQKLSQEACSHAAQNERLPIQFVVQVLYFEQLRLRNALASSRTDTEHVSQSYPPVKYGNSVISTTTSPRDNNSALRRENRELKLEISRLKMKLIELEEQINAKHDKEQVAMKEDSDISLDKTSSTSRFFSSMSRKLGKMNPFFKSSSRYVDSKQHETNEPKTVRRRRHSIS